MTPIAYPHLVLKNKEKKLRTNNQIRPWEEIKRQENVVDCLIKCTISLLPK